MSHSTDFDSTPHPNELQEIRSWAARSPDSVRPSFRMRQLSGLRSTPRLVASALLAALVFLFSVAGYRFFQTGQDAPAPVILPEPEQVASSAPAPAPPSTEPAQAAESPRAEARKVEKALPIAEIAPPTRLAPAERVRKAAVVQPKSALEQPRSSKRVVVNDDAFESEPAVLLSAPTADYPDAARGTGTSAEVVVGFTIDETGAVRNPAVESARVRGNAPEPLFEEAALAAARRARFHPARERGVPTSIWGTLTFSFETGAASAGI